MARLSDKGLSGRIGPVIYYEMNGKQFARAVPVFKKLRTTARQKNASLLFGICSKTATAAAYVLQAYLTFPFKALNRFRGWVYKYYKLHHQQSNWVLGQKFIPPFQLNTEADLRDFLFFPIEIKAVENGRLHIYAPAFDPVKQIMNPLQAASASISIMVQGLSFGEQQDCFSVVEKITVDLSATTSPANDLFFEHAAIQSNAVLMVTIALQFHQHNGSLIKNTNCLPAAVIGMGRVREI